jgi:hypothetical protein
MPRKTVDLADLTLDELDAVEALRRESGCGYTVAAVTVHGRRTDPALDVDTVRAMRSGDVSVIDTTEDDEPGPTPAP